MTHLRLCMICGLLTAAGFLLSTNGCGGGSATSVPPPQPAPSIQHIVVIVQENRTPDNLFQDPVLIARGADIRQSGINSLGQTIALAASPLSMDYDLDHSHKAFEAMYDNGKMDGANLIEVMCNGETCPKGTVVPPNPQFLYVQASDVAPYFQMAEQYTFGDRMFQTNQGPSFPAHQFIISGTSAPSATSNLFAAENGHLTNGCISPAGAFVPLVGPNGQESGLTPIYPCFEHPTLTDELDSKGLSWRYYASTPTFIWTAPNAIQHMCQPQTQNGTLTCTGSTWAKVIIPQTQVLTDIANHQLASVSWVTPSGQASDHPLTTDGSGPSWVASIVNAIGTSSYWSNTVIIITWDDWGGWYDHVPPPQVLVNCAQWGCGYVYGFRVPLIIISPYAKTQYISHVNHDFGSLLKFIEGTFGLPSLGYADAGPLADDLSDCFDFTQTPTQFHSFAAKFDAAHFLNDKQAPLDPDDD
jgi:phospholipase C